MLYIIQPMVDMRAARGARIQQAILDSGKSQREIAELIGVAPQSITKWIKTGKIYVDNLHALAELTGVDLRYIVSGYTPHHVSDQSEPYTTNRSELINTLDKLDAQQVHKLLICAQAFLEADADLDVSITVGGHKRKAP